MIESTLKQRQHIRLHIGRWRPENATLFMVKQFNNWNQIWCHQIWWRWWYVGGGGRGNGVIISQMPVKLTEASINFINSTNETVDRYLWIDLFLLLLLFLFILFDLTFLCVCVCLSWSSSVVLPVAFVCVSDVSSGGIYFYQHRRRTTGKHRRGRDVYRPCFSFDLSPLAASRFARWFFPLPSTPHPILRSPFSFTLQSISFKSQRIKLNPFPFNPSPLLPSIPWNRLELNKWGKLLTNWNAAERKCSLETYS